MTITKFQLKSIIKEERVLAVEKQRLRDVINEEYRAVLQEAANDKAFYKLIQDAKPGDKVSLWFRKEVKKGLATVFVPGRAYIGTVPDPKTVKMGHESILFFGDASTMSKAELIKDIKKAGGPGVLDLEKSTVTISGRTMPIARATEAKGATAVTPAASPAKTAPVAKKTVAKAPGEREVEDTIQVDADVVPAKGYYRHALLGQIVDHAHLLSHKAMIKGPWQQNPGLADEPGPPRWLGHTTKDDPDWLHFHPPEWNPWKTLKFKDGEDVNPPTHRIKSDGTIEKYTPPPKAKAPAKAKTPEPAPEKEAEVVTGEVGKIISVPKGKIPGPGWFRIQGSERAVHVDDSKWIDRGYGWTPRPGEEKGPPGFLGHRETHTELQEALPGARPGKPFAGYDYISGLSQDPPEEQKKGVLHFHHPDWLGWKKMKAATHVVGKDGTPGERAAVKPAAEPAGVPKAATAGTKVKPTVVSKDPKGKTFEDIPEKLKDRSKSLEALMKRRNQFCASLKERGKTVWLCIMKDAAFRALLEQGLGPAGKSTPAAEPEVGPAGKSTPAAEPEGENAWIGKTARQVVKLTKAELKKTLKRSVRANDYGGNGWRKGGLQKLRYKHPLRKKFRAWYKWYYSAGQKKKRRAAKKERRRGRGVTTGKLGGSSR